MSAARMSVILVTDRFETIARVVDRLHAQTVADQLEIVIVAPSKAELDLDETAMEGFAALKVVELGNIDPMAAARAAGVRAATAPVVFLGETHSFPEPDFAAALLRAHEQAWDIVVPGVGNANPDGVWSWASFLMDYGQWSDELPAREIGGGPTWNVSYKRAALLELNGVLERALASGDELPVTLRERGHRAYFEPAARIGHINVGRRGWTDERYLSGLMVGSHRKGMWSLGRRLFYVCASPLIPVVILSRIARPVRVLRRSGALPRGIRSALIIGAVVRTVGEVVGYLAGATASARGRMEQYELHKMRYVATPSVYPGTVA
ncbi:MAG TPA: hypothetical protein VES88_02885 [Gemmatimonadaceae bacterium]|nr:hypothetical protein [Gemmatimonadaceae bacterium]